MVRPVIVRFYEWPELTRQSDFQWIGGDIFDHAVQDFCFRDKVYVTTVGPKRMLVAIACKFFEKFLACLELNIIQHVPSIIAMFTNQHMNMVWHHCTGIACVAALLNNISNRLSDVSNLMCIEADHWKFKVLFRHAIKLFYNLGFWLNTFSPKVRFSEFQKFIAKHMR